jgi:hypothetical protein
MKTAAGAFVRPASIPRPDHYSPAVWAELLTLPTDDFEFVLAHPLPGRAIAVMEREPTYTPRRVFPALVEQAYGLAYEPRSAEGWRGVQTVWLGRVAAWRTVHGLAHVWRRMHDRRWGGGKRKRSSTEVVQTAA